MDQYLIQTPKYNYKISLDKNIYNKLRRVWGTDCQNYILMQGPKMADLRICSKVLILPFVGFDLTGESGNSAAIAAQRDSW